MEKLLNAQKLASTLDADIIIFAAPPCGGKSFWLKSMWEGRHKLHNDVRLCCPKDGDDITGSYCGRSISGLYIDEMRFLSSKDLWLLVSRLRYKRGTPKPRFYGTCTPDPHSYISLLVHPWLGPGGLPDTNKGGLIKYLVPGTWGPCVSDNKEALVKKTGHRVEDVLSIGFVQASLGWNTDLIASDPGYVERLGYQPSPEKGMYLHGSWYGLSGD